MQNTTLGPNLLGKTFDVDDGLLKKIRVAQFKPGQSRIVLEVADRSDYDTFLLTGPPRLIIDIHSKDIRGKATQGKDGGNAESLAPANSGQPAMDCLVATRARRRHALKACRLRR